MEREMTGYHHTEYDEGNESERKPSLGGRIARRSPPYASGLRVAAAGLCLVLLAHVGAMRATGQSVRLGVELGVTGSEFDYQALRPGWEPAWSWFPSAGLVAEVPLSAIEGPLGRILLLQTGVRYERPGGRVDWQSQIPDIEGGVVTYVGTFSIVQHTAAVPALLKFRLFRDRVRLVVGPTARFLLVARKTAETNQPETARSRLTTTVTDNLKRVEWTVRYGLEVRATDVLQLQFAYVAGLSDLKKGPDEPVLTSDWRTQGLFLSLILLRP